MNNRGSEARHPDSPGGWVAPGTAEGDGSVLGSADASAMNVLGVSAFYHDSAACLLRDGRLVAASQEERWSRRRHDQRWPAGAIAHCLSAAGITVGDLDLVAFYDKPLLKFERIVETYLGSAPRGIRSFMKAMPLWLREKLWVPDTIRQGLPGYEREILFAEHHESHAASAFFPSPFERAAVLTVDGVGEWTTTSIGVGEGNQLRLRQEIQFPHSLGLLYSAFTYYTGFRVNSGEYKVMGLAPYGTPRYAALILDKLIDLRPDGSFRLDLDYFDYCAGLTMTNQRFAALFEGPPRVPESPVRQRDMDLAASIQTVCEEVMMRLAHHARELTACDDLCLAGGVALNCVSNGRLRREGPFKRIWVQPAAGDAGGAVGAAYVAWHRWLGHPRSMNGPVGIGDGFADGDGMQEALLGPEYSDRADRDVPARSRRRLSFAHRRGAGRAGGRAHRQSEDHRVVPGPDGVRPAGARRAQHSRRPAVGWHAGVAEREDQAPGVVPPVCARCLARARR